MARVGRIVRGRRRAVQAAVERGAGAAVPIVIGAGVNPGVVLFPDSKALSYNEYTFKHLFT